MEKNKYQITEKIEGIRLDKVAVTLDSEISRVTAQRLIEEGKITVNRKSKQTIIQSKFTETQ